MHPTHIANVNRHDDAPRGAVSEADLDRLAAERLNRVPRDRRRLQSPRPTLATRLRRLRLRAQCRLEVLVIQWRIDRLAAEGLEVHGTITHDTIAAAAHEIKFATDPVLQGRMSANRARLRTIGEQILKLQVRQAELELFR